MANGLQSTRHGKRRSGRFRFILRPIAHLNVCSKRMATIDGERNERLKMKIEQVCQDHGNPGCLDKPDEQYTMDYRDVPGGDYIYWCSNCGPVAHSMEKM